MQQESSDQPSNGEVWENPADTGLEKDEVANIAVISDKGDDEEESESGSEATSQDEESGSYDEESGSEE